MPKIKLADRQHIIPEEVFHAIATLVPRLMYIAEEECGLDPIELLTLWHIRHFGKQNPEGLAVCLRYELTEMLERKFRFVASAVTKLLDDLHDNGLILRITITAKQRLQLFGDQHGPRLVVILTQKGDQQIDQFKGGLRARTDNWLKRQSATTRAATRAFRPVAVSFARWLVEQYGPQRDEAAKGVASPSNE